MNIKTLDTENRLIGPMSPASTQAMTNTLVYGVGTLMILGGIETIKIEQHLCGAGSYLHTSIASFPEAPDEIRAQGLVMKDAIAKIMATARISGLTITLEDEELSGVREQWESAVIEAKSASEGSSRVLYASGEGSGSDTKTE